MKGQVQIRSLAVLLATALLCSPLAPTALAESGEMAVAEYYRLAVEVLRTSLAEWTECVQAAESQAADPEAIRANCRAVRTRYVEIRNETFQRYGMTSTEYMEYAGRHAREMREHLKDAEETKTTIDSLTAQINAAIERYEARFSGPAQQSIYWGR